MDGEKGVDGGVHGDNESNTLLHVEEPSSPSSRKHAPPQDGPYCIGLGEVSGRAGWEHLWEGSGSSMSSQALWSTSARLYPI